MNKNKVMLFLVSFTVLLTLATHFFHRKLNFLESYLSLNNIVQLSNQLVILLNILLFIPLILFVVVVLLYRVNPNSSHLPLLNMLLLTFGSISIIAGGNGLVEYHFSIFMVIAFLAFYDSIKLIIISTTIFAIHHLAGYFFFPELICGTTEYKFSLLLIHAVYLIFTSGANIFLILYKEKANKALKEENAKQKAETTEILEKLTYTTNSILSSIQELTVSYEASSNASLNITNNISKMSKEATNQLTSSQTTKELIKGLLNNISSIAEKLKDVNHTSMHSTDQSLSGKIEIEKMNHKMIAINDSVNDISTLIQNLDKKSKEITEISFLISKISEQTRMLSFNASIEAARAGEHGKGFAVVANEIGVLAKQTNRSTEAIHNIIIEIANEISSVTKAMQNGNTVVKEGRAVLHTANQVFENIFQSSKEVKVQTEHLQNVSDLLLEDSHTVLLAFENMNKNAQRTLIQSTNITEASEQQMMTIQTLEKTINSLEQLAKELRLVVKDTNKIE